MRVRRPSRARFATALLLRPRNCSWGRVTSPCWRWAMRAIAISRWGSSRKWTYGRLTCGPPFIARSFPGNDRLVGDECYGCGQRALRNRGHAVVLRHHVHDVAHDAADLEVLGRVDTGH